MATLAKIIINIVVLISIIPSAFAYSESENGYGLDEFLIHSITGFTHFVLLILYDMDMISALFIVSYIIFYWTFRFIFLI